MRRRLAIFGLLLAWLCANGVVWDAVQVVAWSRMFATYSSYLPVGQALTRTFDGSKPCEICAVAQHGRDEQQRQQSPSAPDGAERILLACETNATFVTAAPDFSWPGVVADFGLTRSEPVPVPPPRA